MANGRKSGLAVFSLILGILSILVLGIFAAIPGIITGHMARSKAKKDPVTYGGEGLALTGLILSYLSLILSVAAIWYIGSHPEILEAIKGMQAPATVPAQ